MQHHANKSKPTRASFKPAGLSIPSRGSFLLGASCLLGASLLLSACSMSGGSKAYRPMRFHLESSSRGGVGSAQTAQLPNGETYNIFVKPVLLESQITKIDIVRVHSGRLALLFHFNDEGARSLYLTTASNHGSVLVFKFGNRAVGVRFIDGPITDGRLFTFVGVPDSELPKLFEKLQTALAGVHQHLKNN